MNTLAQTSEWLTDAEIAARLKAGDESLFEDIVKRYSLLIKFIAKKFVSGDEAEDVTQWVFCELWRARDQFDPNKSPFKAWMMRYAYTRAINRNQHLHAQYCDQSVTVPLTPAIPAPCADHDRIFMLRQILFGPNSKLSTNQKRAFRLFLLGFESQEIAEMTGQSRNTIRGHWRRGIFAARKSLEGANV